MKVSFTWLKEYVPCGLSPEKLAHRLTMAGMEVKKIEQRGHDAVFEIEVTPNRPDCLNLLGIAREAAAILKTTVRVPKITKIVKPKMRCDITVDDRHGCQRYIGTLMTGVRVASSPSWLKNRLASVGIRPVNNIVDITNFCLLETGQPMHAFDYNSLGGKKIVVRRARQNEKIVTIDGQERTLGSSVLVIADSNRPVAIAGVMGGKETEVTERTADILLESAYFDPVLTRRAARSVGLSTDASYRFERGVDFEMVARAVDRAVSLITQIAGGSVSAYTDTVTGKQKKAARPIGITLAEINGLLGSHLGITQCGSILRKLGFSVTARASGRLTAVPPSFRDDIKQPVDIVEEIARIIGYDNLPVRLPVIKANAVADKRRDFSRSIKNALVRIGFDEAIGYSLVAGTALKKCRLSP